MVSTDFIAAIELGSSKATGIVGKKNPDGSIQIMAVASEKSSEFIRKGVIYNLDKTSQCLNSIIKRLENTIKDSIGRVYVGISGQSLRTIRNTEVRHLGEETKISQEFIDLLMDSNREVPIIDQEILEVAPQEYKVGINYLTDPVGVPTDHIEGRFLNIIARNSLKMNIDKCFDQSNIEIVDYITQPIAVANAVLTNSEKRSGCMLVDFGADTTTVSLFKNNILRHLAVIPLGGNNITKDICSQQIEEEEAEELKVKFGDAYYEPSEKDQEKIYNIEGKCSIEASLLQEIIEARVNEIISNAWNQIYLSGYSSDKLLAGAVLTGGGANMKNIEEAFTKLTKLDKVRVAKDIQLTVSGAIELKRDGAQIGILSILTAGKEGCRKDYSYKVQHSTNVVADLFDNETAEERKPKQQYESPDKKLAEKRAAEEEKKRKEEELKKKNAEFNSLITKINELKGKEDYKEALSLLKKADALNLPEKREQIKELTQEIKKLKAGPSWISKVGKKISALSEEILKDEK